MSDKQKVKDLYEINKSNNEQYLMVITDINENQLCKEKISDFISDTISSDLENGLSKGSDEKLFIRDATNAKNIIEGTLDIERIGDTGVTEGTYQYPIDLKVNKKGQVLSVKTGEPGLNNANTDLSNITEAGKQVINELGSENVLSDLGLKANVSADNFSAEGVKTITTFGYPDFNSAVAISGNTFTAPSHGYLYVYGYNGYHRWQADFDIIPNHKLFYCAGSWNNYAGMASLSPICKGVKITQTELSASDYTAFIPAKGEI